MTARSPEGAAVARDEALLQAYHDGEAGPAERQAAEAWLAEDPAARALLAALAAGDALLRAAVDAPLREPVPPALLARVEATLAGRLTRLPAGQAAAGAAATPAALRPPRRWLPLALAASIALAVGVPGAWFWSAEHTAERLASLGEARAQALAALETQLQQTLETQVSGTPLPWLAEGVGQGELLAVRTYKSSAGQWCREYRITAELLGEPHRERGIACRDAGGRWLRKVILLDEQDSQPAPGQGT
jgi:hypothetical protein